MVRVTVEPDRPLVHAQPCRVPHEVNGHVEIRWSHGRFAQVPEAKVYLDTPQQLVPGYVPVAAGRDETRLFDPAQRPL